MFCRSPIIKRTMSTKEFQPLLWNQRVGLHVQAATVISFVVLTAFVYTLDSVPTNPTAHETVSLLVGAGMMFSNLLTTNLPGIPDTRATWARPCMHLVVFLAAITNMSIALGLSPVIVDSMTGRTHYTLRWVEWAVTGFTMTFVTESAAAATFQTCLLNGIAQGSATVCGIILPLCKDRFLWLAIVALAFVLYFVMFVRLHQTWRAQEEVQQLEPRTSKRRRSLELSFNLLLACTILWSAIVLTWMVDAVVYGLLGWPRGPVCFAFYTELFTDVFLKLVFGNTIHTSSSLLTSHFTLDAIETAKELRRLIDHANAPIFGVDRNCRVAEWNQKAATITGYSKQEALGKDLVNTFVAAEFRSSVRRVLHNALDGVETDNFELMLIAKHDKRVEILLNATPRFDNSDSVVGVVGFGQDVTEVRQSEAKARQYEGKYSERLARSFDLSLDLVMQIDLSGSPKVYYASPSFSAVLGHPPSSVIGDYRQLSHLLPVGVMMHFPEVMQQMISSPDAFTVEFPLLSEDGARVWFEHKSAHHPDNEQCIVVVSRDVSDRLERHRLEIDNAKLAVSRERDIDAMHFLSHELKNQFVALRGLIEKMLQLLSQHGKPVLLPPYNANEVVMDSISCIDRGVFLCMNQGVALQLAHDSYKPHSTHVDLRAALSAANGRRAEMSVDPDLPTLIIIDQNLFLHILDNFLTNAVKYGAAGKRLTLYARRHLGRLHVAVINLPGSQHDEAVRKYGNKDASQLIMSQGGIQRDSGSTGNGLRIANKCSALLGGEASLCFFEDRVVASVRLPLVSVDDGTAPCLPDKLVVASVDDDDLVRLHDTNQFERHGFAYHIFGSTAEEITGFPSIVAALDPPPQIVLIDQNLDHPLTGDPLRKGTDLIDELREKGFTGKVVIRSSNQSSSDRALYLQSGADGAIDKVIVGDAFVREIAGVLAGLSTHEAAPSIDLTMLSTSDSTELAQNLPLFKERSIKLVQNAAESHSSGNMHRAWNCVHKLRTLAKYIGALPLAERCEGLRHATTDAAWQAGLQLLEAEVTKACAALDKFAAKA